MIKRSPTNTNSIVVDGWWMDGWMDGLELVGLVGSEQQGLTRRFRWTAVASTAASASSSLVLHSLACLVAFAARAAAASRVPVPSIGPVCLCATLFSCFFGSIHPSIQPTNHNGRQPTTNPPTNRTTNTDRVLRSCSQRSQVSRVQRCVRRCGDVHSLQASHDALSPVSRSPARQVHSMQQHLVSRSARDL